MQVQFQVLIKWAFLNIKSTTEFMKAKANGDEMLPLKTVEIKALD